MSNEFKFMSNDTHQRVVLIGDEFSTENSKFSRMDAQKGRGESTMATIATTKNDRRRWVFFTCSHWVRAAVVANRVNDRSDPLGILMKMTRDFPHFAHYFCLMRALPFAIAVRLHFPTLFVCSRAAAINRFVRDQETDWGEILEKSENKELRTSFHQPFKSIPLNIEDCLIGADGWWRVTTTKKISNQLNLARFNSDISRTENGIDELSTSSVPNGRVSVAHVYFIHWNH